MSDRDQVTAESSPPDRFITMFVCGDVMTGRGIDQVLLYPSDPRLYEGYVRDARDYVQLAERKSGPISYPVPFTYVWGDALAELEQMAPDVRIINLETSITRNDEPWPGKGINYRMSPENIPCLTVAGIDCCSLANNHVLDWEYPGLRETLVTLHRAGIQSPGAGQNLRKAQAPAVIEVQGKGRVLTFGLGSGTSGVPLGWAATEDRPGVYLLPDLSADTVQQVAGLVHAIKQPRDVVVASIHWGPNWGYEIPQEQAEFAHQLIDHAKVDIVHGHSSHHVKGIEVYRDKLVLYGCGDFINDYEGIHGYEQFRGDLALMYFPRIDPATGKLVAIRMVPTQMRRFQVRRAASSDALWLTDVLNREGRGLGTRVTQEGNHLTLHWD